MIDAELIAELRASRDRWHAAATERAGIEQERDEWRDRYNREVLGVNNEGDAIGGEPARGLKTAVADLRDALDTAVAMNETALRAFNDSRVMLLDIEKSIHYPDCWDTVAYPTLLDAIKEIANCTECKERMAAHQTSGEQG